MHGGRPLKKMQFVWVLRDRAGFNFKAPSKGNGMGMLESGLDTQKQTTATTTGTNASPAGDASGGDDNTPSKGSDADADANIVLVEGAHTRSPSDKVHPDGGGASSESDETKTMMNKEG